MNRIAAILTMAALIGCGTTGDLPVDVPPEIFIRPDAGIGYLIDRGGTFQSTIEVEITNRASVPVQLVRLEIQTFGAPYEIRQRAPNVGLSLESGETRTISVPVIVTSSGGIGTSDEPTMLRMLMIFHSDAGSFRRIAQFRIDR